MRFVHPDRPGKRVRLAYCLNLYPAEDLDGVLEGLRAIPVPLARRLGAAASPFGFGVGLWLPASVALELVTPQGGVGLERLVRFIREHRLDPFTFNAFPYGGFHREGLKDGVFRPSWKAPERLAFTLAVAEIACRLRRVATYARAEGSHLSVSTHAGGFGAWEEDGARLDDYAESFCLAALSLAKMQEDLGERVVLSLEPEPRSTANDTGELMAFHERTRARALEVLARGHDSVAEVADTICLQHLGTCLDACHAAVEFEDPADSIRQATAGGTALGKLQFSSALAVFDPSEGEARQALFELAEPVYLHQVTGRAGNELARVADLSELESALGSDPTWDAADQWRCHFHVPVDLERFGSLGTTRTHADETLRLALALPDRWGSPELHVEIETYTWDVLGTPTKDGDTEPLLDGLEAEYRHVLGLLAGGGWVAE